MNSSLSIEVGKPSVTRIATKLKNEQQQMFNLKNRNDETSKN